MWHFNIYSWHVANVSLSAQYTVPSLSSTHAKNIVIQLNRRWMTKRINSVRVNYPFAFGAFFPLFDKFLITIWISRGASVFSQILRMEFQLPFRPAARRLAKWILMTADAGKSYLVWLASSKECIIAWMGTLFFFFALPSSLLAHAMKQTDER